MKATTAAMDAHLASAVTSLATCWKITRKDGIVQGFTDHDMDIVLPNEPLLTYISTSGFFRSAISNSATTDVDNLEVKGYLNSDHIKEEDLMNHAYDYAEVEIFTINWADLSMGIVRLRYGLFGESQRYPSGFFTIELRGLTQLLGQTVGRRIVPECDTDLGNPDTCAVKLKPDEIKRGQVYKENDRVLVPVDGVGRAIHLPLLNPSFEIASTDTLHGWTFLRSVATNVPPYVAKEGNSYLAPTGVQTTGFAQQRIKAAALNGATTVSNFTFWMYQFGAHWQARGVIEVMDQFNAPIPAKTKEGTWTELTPLNHWVQITVDGEDEDVTENGWQVRIEWRPDPVFYPNPLAQPTGPAPIIFDLAATAHNGADPDAPSLFSPSFELTDEDISSVFNWGGGFGPVRRIGNINLQPKVGDAYLRISGFSSTTQSVRLDNLLNVTTTELDAGDFELQLQGWAAGEEWGFEYKVMLKFFNINNPDPADNVNTGLISTLTTGFIEARPERFWVPFTLRGEVPSGARAVRIELHGQAGTRQPSNAQHVVYDDLSLDLFDPDYGTNAFSAYGGVEFKCIRGGVTDDDDVVFDPTIDAETDDGTVTWKAVVPIFTFLGEVTAVTDHTHFVISGAASAVDDWFEFGICHFLTGRNAGRYIEVKAWDQSSAAVETALPLLWEPEVNDLIEITAGCDKSPEMCFGRFNNIVNYRGFPRVPGTDEYFKVGGIGT